MIVASDSDISLSKAESMLVLELAVSDAESSVGGREREEPKLSDRRKKPILENCSPSLAKFALLSFFLIVYGSVQKEKENSGNINVGI